MCAYIAYVYGRAKEIARINNCSDRSMGWDRFAVPRATMYHYRAVAERISSAPKTHGEEIILRAVLLGTCYLVSVYSVAAAGVWLCVCVSKALIGWFMRGG